MGFALFSSEFCSLQIWCLAEEPGFAMAGHILGFSRPLMFAIFQFLDVHRMIFLQISRPLMFAEMTFREISEN